MENDRIEKRIELNARISRVWRALTDYREFGEWFRAKLDGPFVAGQVSRGHITYPGYEHVEWEAVVQKIEPERLFSFIWHPYSVDPKIDYSKETVPNENSVQPMADVIPTRTANLSCSSRDLLESLVTKFADARVFK